MLVDIDSVPPFYRNYVRLVTQGDVLEALKASGAHAQSVVSAIPEERAAFRYADGKWSIAEVLCHLMDGERIFGCRALRFARNDPAPLPGYDQDLYVPESNAAARSIARLAGDMARLRASTVDLFASFTPEMLARKGVANQVEVSVLALGCIIAGHERHHIRILQERYLAP